VGSEEGKVVTGDIRIVEEMRRGNAVGRLFSRFSRGLGAPGDKGVGLELRFGESNMQGQLFRGWKRTRRESRMQEKERDGRNNLKIPNSD